jgi:hypothetical protein
MAKRPADASPAESTEHAQDTKNSPFDTRTHAWGMRDWNTLAEKTDVSAVQWRVGMRASGRYLGYPFSGVIKAARLDPTGLWSLAVRFDAPMDVVESEHFSSLRQQVNCTVNAQGASPQKTSNGQPQMIIGPDEPAT